MRTYARIIVALRFPIVLAWVAAAVAVHSALPSIESGEGAPLQGLVADDSPALAAEARSAQLFDVPVLTRTVVVQRDPDGLRPATQARAIAAAARVSAHRDPELQRIELALPVTNTLRVVPGAEERSTTILTYLFFGPSTGLSPQKRLADAYADKYLEAGASTVGVTGAIPARLEQFDAIRGSLSLVEAVTVAAIALILGITFRAPGAPIVALFSAAIGYFVATRSIAAVGGALEVAVPRELEPLILVLLLGIVTDYAIFFLSGFRHRLAEGEARLPAARSTACQFVPIVATAGFIVATGSAALVVGRLEFFRAFGPGMALTALVGLAVAVTLVPALLAIGGRAVYWPSLGGRDEEREAQAREAERMARRSRRVPTSRFRAFAVAVLAVGALGLAATGVKDLRLGFTLISGLPASSEARQAAQAAQEGFGAGILAPTMAIVEAPDVARRRDALETVGDAVARMPGVASVLGPSLQPPQIETALFRSEDGDAVRFIVILEDEPGGGHAIETFRALERRLPRLLAAAGIPHARTSFAGDTALAADTVRRISDDLERIALAALLANLFFLVVFLRALVAPLFLLAASVLALGASLGLATYVFQGLLGHGEITYYVPLAAAVLLVSLGSDYNIFVAGRVWAEARYRPLREAVSVAVPRASRAIAVASIALAASFAVLAIVPLRPFREFAFVMSLGVLIDSFVVRSLLVPALITLFGETSAWPAKRLGAPRRREADQPASG